MERMLGPSHGPSALEAVPARAPVLHAAAALYLGLSNRELDGVLDLGVSLADVAEWQGKSLQGLKYALQNALERTDQDHATGVVALVDQLVDVAQEGVGAWQELVENLAKQAQLPPRWDRE